MAKKRQSSSFKPESRNEQDELDAVNAHLINQKGDAVRRTMEAEIEQKAKESRNAERAATSKRRL
jgi:hypothetical protein